MAIDPKITASEVAQHLGLTVQAIHKRIKVQGLKEKKGSNRVYFGHNTARNIINPKVNPIKISTAVVKGGVGKTTIAEALAVRASLYGLKVLCVDLDQQANLTKGLGMDQQAKTSAVMIDLVEGKASLEESILLHDYISKYDMVVFDCPPTLGSVVCSSMLASDLVIAPINPDVYSYDGIDIMDKEMKSIKAQFNKQVQWKILLNKFDSKTILSTSYISDLIKDTKLSPKLLKSVIRTSQEFPNMKKRGKTIYDTFKKTTAKEDIDSLALEIMAMMGHITPSTLNKE